MELSDQVFKPERYTYQDVNSQTQVTPTSTYNYYYPQAGFNFLGGMSVRF